MAEAKPLGFAHRCEIARDAQLVWQFLTEPACLTQWCAQRAQVDPRQGGRFWRQIDATHEFDAHIDVLLPLRRLRLIYLPSASQPLGQAVLVDDFLLLSERSVTTGQGAASTVIRLLGSGYPRSPAGTAAMRFASAQWSRALGRLKAVLERPTTAK